MRGQGIGEVRRLTSSSRTWSRVGPGGRNVVARTVLERERIPSRRDRGER
jgi:hypothetical protein